MAIHQARTQCRISYETRSLARMTARKSQVVLDVNADEVADLAAKA